MWFAQSPGDFLSEAGRGSRSVRFEATLAGAGPAVGWPARTNQTVPAASPPPPSSRRFAYIGTLDGIRGVFVVLGPLLYHARPERVRGGPDILPGGILSLDLFFVLSSFLIVSIALREWDATGRIDLIAYAGRRVRRLLPALLTAIVLLTLYLVWVGDPGIVPRWTGAMVSALTYSANWHEIAVGASYFERFDSPSPLEHVWSFAIEEQFYVFAPLFVIAGLTWFGRRGRRVLLGTALAAAVASAVWMAFLHTPGQDPSRVYYGTDTRAQALFVGIALALAAHMYGPPRTDRGRRALVAAAYPALALHLWMIARISERDEWMFERGGFLLVAVASAVLIYGMAQPAVPAGAAAHSPGPGLRLSSGSGWRAWLGRLGSDSVWRAWLGRLGSGSVWRAWLGRLGSGSGWKARLERLGPSPLHRFFELAPLRYTGRISYGLYLYHWPIYLLVTPERIGALTGDGLRPSGFQLLAVHLVLTFAAATASYHLIERPIVERRWPIRLRPLAPAGGALAASVAVVAVLAGLLAANATRPARIEQVLVPLANADPAPSSPAAPEPRPADPESSPADATSPDASAGEPAEPSPAPAGERDPLRVLIVGDSVSAQIGWALHDWGIENPGRIITYNESHIGCGVVRFGLKRTGELSGQVGEVCSHWDVPVSTTEVVRSEVVSWPTALDLFRPDVVVAHVSSWDATDRIVPGVVDEWSSIGDPVYDDYVRREYTAAGDLLTSTGAVLYWLLSPQLDRADLPEDHGERVAGLNRLVAVTADDLPDRDILLVDYPSFIGEVGGPLDRARRGDGVHLSDQGTEEVAPWLMDIIDPAP